MTIKYKGQSDSSVWSNYTDNTWMCLILYNRTCILSIYIYIYIYIYI